MPSIGYTPLNLPKALVDELKIWRLAFSAAYGRTISFAEMIRSMLDSLEDSDPGVVEELDTILRDHPEFEEIMAVYRGDQ